MAFCDWPADGLSGPETKVLDIRTQATILAVPACGGSLGPSGLAWEDTNSGLLKVSPLPDQHLKPRHEGNPFASASFDANVGASKPWQGEWVFTEPLTVCSADIRNGTGSIVRTLPCDDRYTKLGEAVIAWDGKDSTGRTVPSASYTWTLTAGDADGAAVDTDGTSALSSGKISVKGVDPLSLTATPTPTITGTAKVGYRLMANPGTWGPAPVTLSYQWYRSGVAITGATGSSYLLTASDRTKAMTVKVTGSKAGYTTVARTSAATTAVATGTLTATPTPTITGTAKVGYRLTANPGTCGPAPVTLSYQWYRSGVAITGATGSSNLLTASDRTKAMTVKVTGSKAGYTTVARASAATTSVQ
ncbi:FlgD immunoglobulin-like domain containing protein [Terrabacter sp. Ter38]|uniref:FlgD immunoglobulin-like domain containing protein n=1 Tax=Terrabacter sp. Ter38 TaxID=2926030 RepID=UPI002117BFC4|nr:FlgD immunoglobulin-like domain containing protein [Terrabacter sp. Ter38]